MEVDRRYRVAESEFETHSARGGGISINLDEFFARQFGAVVPGVRSATKPVPELGRQAAAKLSSKAEDYLKRCQSNQYTICIFERACSKRHQINYL